MEKTKVFVLYAHRDHECYESSTDIIGTYSTKEKAQERMKKSFDDELEDEYYFGEFNKEELTLKQGTDACSILHGDSGEYTQFEIVETILG